MTTITIFTPVEKVTVSDTPNVVPTIKAITDAFAVNGVLALHSPTTSIYIGAEALKNSVVRIDK